MELKSFTMSMAFMLSRCPEQFRRRFGLGEIVPPGVAARRGSALHEAARLNHEHKMRHQQDLPLDYLQDAARDHYRELVLDKGVYICKDDLAMKSKMLAQGQDEAVALVVPYRQDFAPGVWPVLVEERLSLDVGLPWPVSGRLDLVSKLDPEGDGDLWLPDIKSASRAYNQADVDRNPQLTMYWPLVAAHLGRPPAKVSLEAFIATQKPRHESYVTSRSAADVRRLIKRLAALCEQIRAEVFPPTEPGNWWCSRRWCGYYDTCAYV